MQNTTDSGIDKWYRIYQLATYKKAAKPGLIPVGPATIWRWTKEGLFPKPCRLGPGVTVWRAADVQAWLDSKAV